MYLLVFTQVHHDCFLACLPLSRIFLKLGTGTVAHLRRHLVLKLLDELVLFHDFLLRWRSLPPNLARNGCVATLTHNRRGRLISLLTRMIDGLGDCSFIEVDLAVRRFLILVT